MANLASGYRDQGRWEEAEKLEVQVLEVRKEVLGPEHPGTLTSMNNLAFTWKSKAKSKLRCLQWNNVLPSVTDYLAQTVHFPDFTSEQDHPLWWSLKRIMENILNAWNDIKDN
jgi:hypothetical protein